MIILTSKNPSKLRRYQSLFTPHNMEVVGLPEQLQQMEVAETGVVAMENAHIKRDAYGACLEQGIVLAVDDACHTNFLPENMQPGVFVRRLTGARELSDPEVLNFWKQVFETSDVEEKTFTWTFALAWRDLTTGNEGEYTITRTDKVAERFSEVVHPGYPMSSFLQYEGEVRPVSELSKEELWDHERMQFEGFVENFLEWQKQNKEENAVQRTRSL